VEASDGFSDSFALNESLIWKPWIGKIIWLR
jgi:hypothetical protein